ncbi:MAG TPA: hypothetical protein VN040_14940 [Pseudosphingobacterium sp.]|nr:hypothetical protein [Pseudosphingobacterium sp.]
MFNIILPGLLFIGIVIWVSVKLKNWKQRILFLLFVFIGIPAAMLYWFQWGWENREQKFKSAQIECRKKREIEELHILFMGFTERNLASSCVTFHKNAAGKILDSNQHQLDSAKFNEGSYSADYYYTPLFRTDDILEIAVAGKLFTLSNFVLTASANYNMGGAVLNGCRIDSADINGKRTAWNQNMIIHKTDQY